ncbi:hypothetical protein K431DRAFT_112057 [Polychaeton citri CBS 116435]|uniref:Uncharacterized protein n=1 Tax=Polychaeton citri CBS 116435 TaxID=1314669 RepID=A0A9P4Q794_9PEZI|nr:hypothetical protein K431DRAFT_112057 [Polychaeton citri CBS 116435]
MPVNPKEEETHGNLTDQVAKESSDSTASSHALHQEEEIAEHHKAHAGNLGPVIAENLGEPASKDELKKRSEELNK